MNEDMKQFLSIFLQEAGEQMELLEQTILKLEQESSPELLQEIFRAAHTLKGSSRAMGFTSMGELTHAMEDIFDLLRNNQLIVSAALIDALFTGMDALKAMIEEISLHSETSYDTVALTARLRAAAAAQTAPGASTAPQNQTKCSDLSAAPLSSLTASGRVAYDDAVANGFQVYRMMIEVASDSIMKSVRALMTLQALERVGSILTVYPDEEALDNEEFEQSFEVVIATQDCEDALVKAALSINEIKKADIALWMQDESSYGVSDAPDHASVSKAETNPADSNSNREHTVEKESHKPAETKTSVQTQTVRVDVSRLDSLLNLIGELVIDRNRVIQLGAQLEDSLAGSSLVEHLHEVAAHIGRVTDQLQDEIMKARMLPIDNVFNRFPRMIRDLAQKMGKEINFQIEGRETELDRSVIETIGDPLIHMLRNSADHGVEMPEEREKAGKSRTGNIWLRARHQENHIIIEVADDGKGLDPAKLRENAVKKGRISEEDAVRLTDKDAVNLIFASGFSTAAEVSDVSGRGVGMDIVRSNLQRLGATIDIESQVGEGSTFIIKLPLTLAIIRGLLITVHDNIYALPLNSVAETLRLDPSEVRSVRRRPTIVLRGRTLPLAKLTDLFLIKPAINQDDDIQKSDSTDREGTRAVVQTVERPKKRTKREDKSKAPVYVVVVGSAEKQVGLIVDRLIGEQEVVIKSLGNFIGKIPGVSGATILGDGQMALIADVEGVINMAAEMKGMKNAC